MGWNIWICMPLHKSHDILSVCKKHLHIAKSGQIEMTMIYLFTSL